MDSWLLRKKNVLVLVTSVARTRLDRRCLEGRRLR
jgi:hypothetical protein